MFNRRQLWLLVVAGALALLVAAVVQADDEGQMWDVSGIWYDTNTGDGTGSLTIITRTGAGRYIMEGVYAGPPLLPGEAKRTLSAGPLRRVGRNQWHFTMLVLIRAADGSVIWNLVGTGDLDLASSDKLHSVDLWAVYGADQDPFGGDPPALGYFGPYDRLGTRVPLVTLDPE